MNIIVHNLEESNASDGPARKQADIKKCISMFQTHLGLSISITNAFRLGKRSGLLKVPLSSNKDKVSKPSAQKEATEQDELYVCDGCKRSSEYVLQCKSCCSWFCNVCFDIPVDLFNGISGIKSFHWFCASCDGSVMGIISKSTGNGSISEVIDSEIHRSLDKVMGQFIEVLTEKTKQFQNAVQAPMPAVEAMDSSNVPARYTPDSGHRTVAAAVDEYVDRERGKQNLIIHNLPEPSECPDTERSDKEKQQVAS